MPQYRSVSNIFSVVFSALLMFAGNVAANVEKGPIFEPKFNYFGHSATLGDSSQQKTNRFFSKYFNPYISLGLGFDRALYMPAIGFKSGLFYTQASIFVRDKSSLFVLNSTLDLPKNYITNRGFYRANISASYIDYFSDMNTTAAVGLFAGFTSYQWSGRTCLQGKVGMAARENQVAFGIPPENKYAFFPIVSLGFHVFQFRLHHVDVIEQQ